MIQSGYVIAMIFELCGIGVVILDLRANRATAEKVLVSQPLYQPPAFLPQILRSNSPKAQARIDARVRQEAARVSESLARFPQAVADADLELREIVAVMLRPESWWRRWRGPLLLSIGVIIGTIANIANTH